MTGKNLIMGILNLTPDSFSDGGRFHHVDDAIERAHEIFTEGADWIDIGAESSRPGALPVSERDEWARLEPVLSALTEQDLGSRISVDTYKPEVMLKAARMGVSIINDIKGARQIEDSVLCELARLGVTYIAMHMKGDPGSMQQEPLDCEEALDAMGDFYEKTTHRLMRCGFNRERICLDPGIGFGKTDRANVRLLAHALRSSEAYQIVLGVSRKSFIGRGLNIENPAERDLPSKMLEFGLMLSGVKAIRTHEVKTLYGLKEWLH